MASESSIFFFISEFSTQITDPPNAGEEKAVCPLSHLSYLSPVMGILSAHRHALGMTSCL